jgi:hypothetical protein
MSYEFNKIICENKYKCDKVDSVPNVQSTMKLHVKKERYKHDFSRDNNVWFGVVLYFGRGLSYGSFGSKKEYVELSSRCIHVYYSYTFSSVFWYSNHEADENYKYNEYFNICCHDYLELCYISPSIQERRND